MKILFLQETDWLKRNPIDQHHVAEILSLKGHDFRVIDFEIAWRTNPKKEFWSKRKVFKNIYKVHIGANITVVRPGFIKLPLIEYISLAFSQKSEIERQIREFRPDVIIGLGGIYSCLAGQSAKANSIPFITYWVDVHHRLVNQKILQFIGWIIEHRTVKLADKIIVANDNLRDYIISIGGQKDRIKLLSTGVDIQLFNPKIDGSSIRNTYGIKKDDLVLLFMGWLYRFSGLKEVALEIAKMRYNGIKLLIVGEGDAFTDLVQIITKYNIKDNIILTGKQPYEKMPYFIAASDICMLPAYPNEKIMKDIVPIKLYEYGAMEKPTISTKLPGVFNRFGFDNGIIYIDKPENLITKAIELKKNGTIELNGSKARRFAETNSWENIARELEIILKELTKANGNGLCQ